MTEETPERAHRLADETSPYLQQHADNPVEWYPWGEEALRTAREEDKPIFLSIGYSACHWCHVMEEESFEDPETAELMNELFVNIKVDREERPDLDEIYMQAVQALTGRGGWPMSVFLTPDLKPFYGGTYFPDQAKQGMPAFKDVLHQVHQAYVEKQDEVRENADQLTDALRNLERTDQAGDLPGDRPVEEAYRHLQSNFDDEFGGFGDKPKFPRAAQYQLLARKAAGGASDASRMLKATLDGIRHGGIYDRVGGGFSRYSVDQEWHVPHFEKMLYDNAQLLEIYSTGYQLFEEPAYRRVVDRTVQYIRREMTHPDGGFYSSQDADSDGVEGKYYVWDHEEFLGVVDDRAELLAEYWNVRPEGNWEGTNVLRVTEPTEEFLQDRELEPEEFHQIRRQALDQLREARSTRTPPHRDEKVLANWNGLMAAGLLRASWVFDEPGYRELARGALEFVEENHRSDENLYHTYRDGTAHTLAYLDDYAFLIKAYLEDVQLGDAPDSLRRARELTEQVVDRFWDGDEKGFYYVQDSVEDALVRSKNPQDQAQPSGNSEMVHNLLKLARLTGEDSYRDRARETLEAFAGILEKRPPALFRMVCGLSDFHGKDEELVLVGQADSRKEYLEQLRGDYRPGSVRLLASPEHAEDWSELTTLLTGRLDGSTPAFYRCRGGACEQPVTEPSDLELG